MIKKMNSSRNKVFSAISVLIAIVVFSTTVFANGIINENNGSSIEFFNDGERMNFVNQPFAANGTVYMPLREFMQKLGMDDETGIVWDNGKITLYLEGHSDYYVIEIDKKQINYDSVEPMPNSFATRDVENPPLLVNDKTYIPYEYINFIFNRFRDHCLIDYKIYDSNKNIIGFSKIQNMLFDEKFYVEIPSSWTGKVESIYDVELNDVSYVQKTSFEKYNVGTLFSIRKVESAVADELLKMLGGSKLIYDDGEFAYLFIVPTDVQMPIWEGADEEDAKIVEEYKKLYADVENIAENIKPANAEWLSFTEMEKLQSEVDNGHYPWRLTPNDVILEFANKQGLSGGEIQNLTKDIAVSADYKYSDDIYKIELYQPIKVNDSGAWVVKNFDKIK